MGALAVPPWPLSLLPRLRALVLLSERTAATAGVVAAATEFDGDGCVRAPNCAAKRDLVEEENAPPLSALVFVLVTALLLKKLSTVANDDAASDADVAASDDDDDDDAAK